jgi:hypothetical protein
MQQSHDKLTLAPSLRSGFRQRAQTPANRLNFGLAAAAASLRMTVPG